MKLFLHGAFFATALLISNYSVADDADAHKIRICQRIKDKIGYYTDLRRKGGSADYMNSLAKKRNDYKDKYSDNNCKKYRNHLD